MPVAATVVSDLRVRASIPEGAGVLGLSFGAAWWDHRGESPLGDGESSSRGLEARRRGHSQRGRSDQGKRFKNWDYRELERIPVTWEHSPHAAGNCCILAG